MTSTKLFARGVNFMGQLGLLNRYQNSSTFQEIQQLNGRQIEQVESHFTHSFCRLNDGQILHWGYVLDSLTSTRILNYYKSSPKLCQTWQKYSPLGRTLSMRLGEEQVNLMNVKTVMQKQAAKFSVGGGFILALNNDGSVFGLGENYKGQLGTGDLGFKHHFEQLKFDTKEKIIDITAGYQHSIFLTESGYLYGTGRANWHQIVPFLKEDKQDSRSYVDFHKLPKRMVIKNEKVKKMSAGFSHTIFLTLSNKIYGIGLNNHGQCGASNLNRITCDEYHPVYTELDSDEKIIDIAAGKSHNIFITNKKKIFAFGATIHNQIGRLPEFDIDQCSPTQVRIEMDEDEYPTKVKAAFDRSAVFTNKGNCYVWGGEDLRAIGAENYGPVQNLKKEMGLTSEQIKDVGLGYLHTLVLVEQ
ncbi:hypothetical protein ABPG74_015098 [Tetrahymena malaccensis]